MRLNRTAIPLLVMVALFTLLASAVYAAGPSINLPPSGDMVVAYPGASSYFATTLNVPDGYQVSDGTFVGWCVDENNYITPGTHYTVTLYSSYDPAIPYHNGETANWAKVNYILNHQQGSWSDVQAALWYFIDHGNYPSDPDAQAMIADANANGATFVPAPGEIMAIVLWTGTPVQTTIIQVIVPPQNVVPEFPVGTILGGITIAAALALFKYKPKMPKF